MMAGGARSSRRPAITALAGAIRVIATAWNDHFTANNRKAGRRRRGRCSCRATGDRSRRVGSGHRSCDCRRDHTLLRVAAATTSLVRREIGWRPALDSFRDTAATVARSVRGPCRRETCRTPGRRSWSSRRNRGRRHRRSGSPYGVRSVADRDRSGRPPSSRPAVTGTRREVLQSHCSANGPPRPRSHAIWGAAGNSRSGCDSWSG